MSKFINLKWLIFNAIILFLACFHNILPKVLEILFKTLNCKKLTSELLVMTDNPEFYCYHNKHKILLFRTIPFFLLWGFIVPLIMFIVSVKR